MKKSVPLLLFCFLTAVSCSKNELIINGRVENTVFNGSKAYILGPGGAGSAKEDSAIIRNGKFTFKLQADSMAVRSIIIPSKGKDGVQELIFIKEIGNLYVVISENSRSSGTRLNRLLMEWKRSNIYYDSVKYELYYKTGVPGITREKYDSLVKISAEVDSSYIAKNKAIIEQNTENGIGLFLFKFYYDHLPLETRKSILEKCGDLYLSTDPQLWSKVMFDKELPKEEFLE